MKIQLVKRNNRRPWERLIYFTDDSSPRWQVFPATYSSYAYERVNGLVAAAQWLGSACSTYWHHQWQWHVENEPQIARAILKACVVLYWWTTLLRRILKVSR
jgi:hypothetical protein